MDQLSIANLYLLSIKASRFCQSKISGFFYFIFIIPTLKFTKFVTDFQIPEEKKEKQKELLVNTIVIDTLIPYHGHLLRYLETLFKINSMLSGLASNRDAYSRLVVYKQEMPIMGFKSIKTAWCFQLLFKEVPGGRQIDLSYIENHKYHGDFKIISRDVDELKKKVLIKCLWLTGEDTGSVFTINKLFPFTDKGYDKTVSAIYCFPNIFIVLFEIICLAGAVYGFLQLFMYFINLYG